MNINDHTFIFIKLINRLKSYGFIVYKNIHDSCNEGWHFITVPTLGNDSYDSGLIQHGSSGWIQKICKIKRDSSNGAIRVRCIETTCTGKSKKGKYLRTQEEQNKFFINLTNQFCYRPVIGMLFAIAYRKNRNNMDCNLARIPKEILLMILRYFSKLKSLKCRNPEPVINFKTFPKYHSIEKCTKPRQSRYTTWGPIINWKE